MVFIQNQQISRRHMLHTPDVACIPKSFLLWLCSRRNIFHFLRNKCYDSHMDWIKSTKTRPLSQRPQLFIKKTKNTCPMEIQSGYGHKESKKVPRSCFTIFWSRNEADVQSRHFVLQSVQSFPFFCMLQIYSARTCCLCSGTLIYTQ